MNLSDFLCLHVLAHPPPPGWVTQLVCSPAGLRGFSAWLLRTLGGNSL